MNPLVVGSNLIRDEILLETSRCQVLLSKSVGVKISDHLATSLSSSITNSAVTPSSSSNLQIDGGLVAALLQTTKGKKLVTRSLPILPSEQRYLIIIKIIFSFLFSLLFSFKIFNIIDGHLFL